MQNDDFILFFLQLSASIPKVIFVIFTFSVVIQLFYYFFYFIRILTYDEPTIKDAELPISVVIAVKNGEAYLKNLEVILNQNYSKFEVIVVNNFSTDNTLAILQNIKDDRLRIYDFNTKEGKKEAIQFGILQAEYDHLLFTDIDCRPTSTQWLKIMANKFINEKEIVIGYSKFYSENTVVNSMIRFENLINSIQMFSFALAGEPYAAVGRNFGYSKAIFLKSNAYKNYHHILSGDDDLIVNELGTAKNVAICILPKAQTLTHAASGWKMYFSQRRRQLVAGNYYKNSDRLKIAIYGLSNLFFYFFFFFLIISGFLPLFILSIFVFKLSIEYFLLKKISKKLNDQSNLLWLPLLEPIYLFTISVIGISTWFWKVNKWK